MIRKYEKKGECIRLAKDKEEGGSHQGRKRLKATSRAANMWGRGLVVIGKKEKGKKRPGRVS